MDEFMGLDPLPLAYAAMTRSTKITVEKLRRRDPGFVEEYERYIGGRPG
jgi:hypothetical protein